MSAKAKECRAGGCTRKTTNPHGYCWQHADMALPADDYVLAGPRRKAEPEVTTSKQLRRS